MTRHGVSTDHARRPGRVRPRGHHRAGARRAGIGGDHDVTGILCVAAAGRAGAAGRDRCAGRRGAVYGYPAGDPVPTLFTPAQAADLLQVPESWLRRRAARRLVPCTFLGKHLRFSRADLDQILADAARPATPARAPASGTSAAPRRRGRPPARARIDSADPMRGNAHVLQAREHSWVAVFPSTERPYGRAVFPARPYPLFS